MYFIGLDSSNLDDIFFMFCIIFIGLLVVAYVALYLVKQSDNSKELITCKVKVIEKSLKQGNIEWCVVECENGKRLNLRNFQANRTLIAVGDVGILSYRGKTIQSFERQ